MGTGVVQVPPDSTGKKIDCASVSVSGATVYRQVVVIGDPTASAGYANVTGGAVKVTGQLSLGPSTNNIGAVSLAAGTANIGFINNISATVVVAGVVSLGAGTNLIGAVSNAAGTALIGAVSLAAGTANIGFINNISATVTVVASGFFDSSAGSTTLVRVGDSANTAIRCNIVAGISATAVCVGSGFYDSSSGSVTTVRVGDSANSAVRVNIVAGGTGGGLVSITGTATVVLGAGTSNIGTVGISSGTLAMSGVLDGISSTVMVAVTSGTLNMTGTIDGISATVTVAGNVSFGSQLVYGASLTVGSVVNIVGLQAKISAGATGSATFAWADLQGRQVTMPFHPPLAPSASHGPKTLILSTSATTALIAAPGVNAVAYVTSFRIQNTNASVATVFNVFEGANSAAPVIKGYVGANTTLFCIHDFRFMPPLRVSANTALNITCDTNVSDIYINIHFYVGP